MNAKIKRVDFHDNIHFANYVPALSFAPGEFSPQSTVVFDEDQRFLRIDVPGYDSTLVPLMFVKCIKVEGNPKASAKGK